MATGELLKSKLGATPAHTMTKPHHRGTFVGHRIPLAPPPQL